MHGRSGRASTPPVKNISSSVQLRKVRATPASDVSPLARGKGRGSPLAIALIQHLPGDRQEMCIAPVRVQFPYLHTRRATAERTWADSTVDHNSPEGKRLLAAAGQTYGPANDGIIRPSAKKSQPRHPISSSTSSHLLPRTFRETSRLPISLH